MHTQTESLALYIVTIPIGIGNCIIHYSTITIGHATCTRIRIT